MVLLCEHPIHPKALTVIAQCQATAATNGVRLEVRASPTSAPIALPQRGNELEDSIHPATEADCNRISAKVAAVLGLLRSRYGDVQLRRTAGDLQLFQRLHDDGGLRAGQEDELEAVGTAFGDVLAAQTPLRWVTVEWQGERSLGLQYPDTTLIVIPGSMIAKRVNRGEPVEFQSLFRSTIDLVEQLKDAPEYKR